MNCNGIQSNNMTDMMYHNKTNKDVDTNSNISNDSELDF